MPESIRPEKNILAFNQGLNTESSEIAFPDGFTTDERNYELLLDGSRRRRKGLAQESGGSDKTTGNAANGSNQTYVWKNVAGNPEKTFIVHKFGADLYFTDDAETISTTYNASSVCLDTYKVDDAASPSASTVPTQFASARGYLIVTSKGHYPLAIEYDVDTDTFTVTELRLYIRNFTDKDDGINNDLNPTTLTDDLRFNLLNRGWSDADLEAYVAAEGVYPNKSVAFDKAYRRTTATGYADEDGIRAFDSARHIAEPTSTASAPKGALLTNIIDDLTVTPVSDTAQISAFSYTDNGASYEVKVTTAAAHGLIATDTFSFVATTSKIDISDPPEYGTYILNWEYSDDNPFTVLASPAPTTTEVYFTYTGYPIGTSGHTILDFDYQLGSISFDLQVPQAGDGTLTVGPRACAFHDGRAFYAGIDDSNWSDYIFFSQIPDKLENLEKCYQEADPTNPENNQMVDTDGGWFVIQGIQGVRKMLSVRGALLVFAENGVWEVGGGQRGFFTPGGYSIRKITEAGCNSPLSPIAVQNTALYTGPEGIFRIAPNQYTGVLEATSVSKQLIQTKWNAITEEEQRRVMSVYDDAKQLVLFLYGKASSSGYYDEILILDLEIPSWYYYSYIRTSPVANTGIMSAYAISYTDSTEQANKIKFSCNVTNTTTVRTCDHAQTDYIDFDGAESPLPYVVTGWDSMGVTSGLSSRVETQRRRQAPIVTVYSKRTETGYTDTGAGWSGDNESSSLMTAYWDWTNDAVSGKIGDQQQVYRHTRAFTPSGASDVDGYPVVVTRNKVRGRGRVLQLRFDGEATKDSHIMGFTVNYRAQRSY